MSTVVARSTSCFAAGADRHVRFTHLCISKREMERRNTDSCKLVHVVLDTPGRLGKILLGMNRALGEIPVTVKLRTGVKEGRNNAHKLMPRIACEWGASAITLHGRTRQQRYTKLADWDYIQECGDAVRAREEEEGCTSPPALLMVSPSDCISPHFLYVLLTTR